MPQDLEAAVELGRREAETFRRIHRLYKHGFRPDWSVTDVEDAIWWKHPGGFPDLILYPDGMLVAVNGRATLSPGARHDKDRIYNEAATDGSKFDHWLSSAPRPTWWQAGRYGRERYIWMPIGIAFFYGLLWLFATGVETVGRAIWRGVMG
ncbi:hypothetical protein [Novosphingobium sp. FKTRR1]|uniref:hypothetical protein n=1 Tax=Novosphingobium sp. FKTRR1 TaxID=2879118 RepID=UPI001CF0655A|nr:hypothetical protein [Novosphingobium sp. FKTRR1]